MEERDPLHLRAEEEAAISPETELSLTTTWKPPFPVWPQSCSNIYIYTLLLINLSRGPRLIFLYYLLIDQINVLWRLSHLRSYTI